MRGIVPSVLLAALLLGGGGVSAQTLIMASTTSTEQSGLFKHLLPIFEQKAGIQVRVVALGTGQSLEMVFPRNGSPAGLMDGFLAVRSAFAVSQPLAGLLG